MLQTLLSYFFSQFRFTWQTLWFKRLLALFILLKCFYWLIYFDLLFGANSIVYSKPQEIHSVKDLAFLLYSLTSAYWSYAFILVTAILTGLSLFNSRFSFIIHIVIWFLVLNINNKIYSTLTGGDFLLNQFLFFNCFLANAFTTGEKWQTQIRICFHNLSCIAVMLQLCLVYFISALAKVYDQSWITGNALVLTAQIKHFSLYSFLSYNPLFEQILTTLNYLVLFYQLSFSLLVWIKPLKKPLLVFGVLMHVYIALVMGLMEFGSIMVLAYVYFWPQKQAVS